MSLDGSDWHRHHRKGSVNPHAAQRQEFNVPFTFNVFFVFFLNFKGNKLISTFFSPSVLLTNLKFILQTAASERSGPGSLKDYVAFVAA